MTLNRAGIALVPKETRCDANLLPVRSARAENRPQHCLGHSIRTADEQFEGAAASGGGLRGYGYAWASGAALQHEKGKPTTEGLPI
jgi:hypothetical protein